MKSFLNNFDRFSFVVLLVVIFELPYHNSCYGQEIEILQKAQKQLKMHNYVPDSIINNLILIHNSKLTNDSLKVDIVYLFGDYLCEPCLDFLIENIKTQYAYGNGISEFDQMRQTAALSVLHNISHSPNKWILWQPLLNSLKRDIRKEKFVIKIKNLLSDISNETTAKSIIEIEISESKRQMTTTGYSVYNENLKLLLMQFDK